MAHTIGAPLIHESHFSMDDVEIERRLSALEAIAIDAGNAVAALARVIAQSSPVDRSRMIAELEVAIESTDRPALQVILRGALKGIRGHEQ
jgi:hypothetical protein